MLLSIVWLINSAVSASAHRLHAGLTVIELNHDQTEIQITHRLFAHDLEQVLFAQLGSGWQQDQKTHDFIGNYAKAHFAIQLDGQLLRQSYVGAEAEAEFIFIYFTAPMPKQPKSVTILNTLLTDQFEDQVNLNNLEFGSGVLSASLNILNPTKTLALKAQ